MPGWPRPEESIWAKQGNVRESTTGFLVAPMICVGSSFCVLRLLSKNTFHPAACFPVLMTDQQAKLKRPGADTNRQLAATLLPNTAASAASAAVIRVPACPGGCIIDAIYHSGDACLTAQSTTGEQVAGWLASGCVPMSNTGGRSHVAVYTRRRLSKRFCRCLDLQRGEIRPQDDRDLRRL